MKDKFKEILTFFLTIIACIVFTMSFVFSIFAQRPWYEVGFWCLATGASWYCLYGQVDEHL